MNENGLFFSVGLVSFFCFLSQVTLIILITFLKLRRSFHLVANDDAVPARGAPVLAILRRAITAVITIAAAGPTAVETNALALACDAVALARAVGAVG